MNDFELVQQLKLELIQAYEPYVRTVAGLTSTPLEDAREAFHTAICKMLAGLRKRPPGNPIVAWRPYIIQAAVNQLREAPRRTQRLPKKILLFSELTKEEYREVLGKEAPGPTPAQQLEEKETARILWAEVASLSPRQAEVLKMWAHGSNFRDIAASLGIKTWTAYNLWSKGIEHLRRRPRVQRLAA